MSVPTDDSGEWAQVCRAEAARTSHAPTRELLLTLAAEFEAANPSLPKDADPDDPDAQQAVADRLMAYAARRRLGQGG